MRIIVHGTLALDRIMVYPGYFKESILPEKIHQISVSFTVEEMSELRGGTGGNIVYNLHLLQQPSTLISALGSNGASYLELLRSFGVDMSAVELHNDILTAAFSVVTDIGNNQIGAFFVGALARPTHFDCSALNPEDTVVILAPANNTPETMKYLRACKQYNLRYFFDPGQTISAMSGDELRAGIEGSAFFIANDYELELMQQKTGLTQEQIQEMPQVLALTLGAEGSVIRARGEQEIHIPAFKQDKLVDPTGAGDAYRAGLLVGYSRGLSLQQIGELGACAASYAIEHVGTQEHTYTMDQFRQRYQENTHQPCPV